VSDSDSEGPGLLACRAVGPGPPVGRRNFGIMMTARIGWQAVRVIQDTSTMARGVRVQRAFDDRTDPAAAPFSGPPRQAEPGSYNMDINKNEEICERELQQ
jgi:hypothetical protein